MSSSISGKISRVQRLTSIAYQCLQHRIIKSLSSVLEAAGSSLEQAVKVNVFLADMADFGKMNEVYTQYWGEQKPCRT
jgi:enamine deaminase RidA (YjgF/YER057c/UK114 family)